MILNSAKVDWITATTNDFRKYQMTVWEILPGDRSGERSSFQQYKGDSYGGVFHGQAEVKGRTSYLIRVSGAEADEHWEVICRNGLKVTRFDLQVTILKPEWYHARELKDAIEFGVWPGQSRLVELRERQGNDTVYVGSRTSDRFIRIYVKEDDFLRFEIEFKQERAVIASKMMLEQGRMVARAVLVSEINKMPDNPVSDEFKRVLGDSVAEVKVPYLAKDKHKTLKWIATILPALERASLDHDIGDRVTIWLMSVIDNKFSSEKDKSQE